MENITWTIREALHSINRCSKFNPNINKGYNAFYCIISYLRDLRDDNLATNEEIELESYARNIVKSFQVSVSGLDRFMKVVEAHEDLKTIINNEIN